MWAGPFHCVGAGNGIRTRDIQLGRLTLYQLSYSRASVLRELSGGGRRIRTFEGVSRQIYSLLPLAARASLLVCTRTTRTTRVSIPPLAPAGAGGGRRTRDPPLTRRSVLRLRHPRLSGRLYCPGSGWRRTCPAPGLRRVG